MCAIRKKQKAELLDERNLTAHGPPFYSTQRTIHPAFKADISLPVLSPGLGAWLKVLIVTALAKPDGYPV